MNQRFVSIVFVAALFVSVGARAQDSKKTDNDGSGAELKKLEGNWNLIRKEHKGRLWPGVDVIKEGLFFEEEKIFWTRDGREGGNQKGDLTIDATTSPKSIDVEITRGSFIGKKMLGIYEIKGKKLTICWNDPGNEKRPKKFVTKPALGAGSTMEVYTYADGDAKEVSEKKGAGSKDDKKGADTKKDDNKDGSGSAVALKKLEGNWKLVRKEYKGRLWPGVDVIKEGIFIEDDKIVWTRDGREAGGQKGDLTVDATAKPRSIEVEVTRGSNIGKKLLGIYDLKGNKLVICWNEPGSEKRPRKFLTTPAVGAGTEMSIYQKEKD